MEAALRLLVVEDDPALGDAIARHLRQDGYAVDLERDGAAADELLHYQHYDLVVLDLGLPGMDGISILKALRRRGDKTPALILTARSAIDDRIDALDIGADDFLPKPFDVREFQARCRALLRRSRGMASEVVTIGKLTFDGVGKRVKIGDTQIILPNREFRLLEILIANAGRVIDKEKIAHHLFDFDHDAGPNAIEVYVGRLRRKLGDSLQIETVRGMGYVVAAPPKTRP